MFRSVKGNKIEAESKNDMKDRVKKSPDFMDCACIGVEGARRLGFKIERIGRDVKNYKNDEEFFDKEAREWDDAVRSGLIKH